MPRLSAQDSEFMKGSQGRRAEQPAKAEDDAQHLARAQDGQSLESARLLTRKPALRPRPESPPCATKARPPVCCLTCSRPRASAKLPESGSLTAIQMFFGPKPMGLSGSAFYFDGVGFHGIDLKRRHLKLKLGWQRCAEHRPD
jgi:hypothetical protein